MTSRRNRRRSQTTRGVPTGAALCCDPGMVLAIPGHGDTGTDSHTGLPVIHHSLRQWWATDAPPFQAAIRAGVDEIMIGHIEVPALDDSGQPASLSRKIVPGLLRDRLGYQGVVVTDSLQMAGVLLGHTPDQVAVRAIQAGCDQLLMPGDPGRPTTPSCAPCSAAGSAWPGWTSRSPGWSA